MDNMIGRRFLSGAVAGGALAMAALAPRPVLAGTPVSTPSLSGLVNAKQAYGAKGDGTTDDTTALQNALNSGNSIFLPPGTYITSAPLVMNTNGQQLTGLGDQSVIQLNNTTSFCALAVVQGTTDILISNFKITNACTSEPSGPAPTRGLVLGTNSSGTAHNLTAWVGNNRITGMHITGVIPGTNGFNVGMQINKSNYSFLYDSVIDSIYGTDPSFGYGVVFDADYSLINNCIFDATISGQGRHAIYFTDTTSYSRAVGCLAQGFQNEAFTTNMNSGGVGLGFIGCDAVNCGQSMTGTTSGIFDIGSGATFGLIQGCRVFGGSNRMAMSLAGNGHTVDGFYCEAIQEHAILAVGCSMLNISNVTINGCGLADSTTYGGIELQGGSQINIDGVIINATARFGVRFNSGTIPNYVVIDKLNVGASTLGNGPIENPQLGTGNRVDYGAQVIGSYTPGSTTIFVGFGVTSVVVANSLPTTVAGSFVGLIPGQKFTLYFQDANTTISRSNTYLLGSVNFVSTNHATLTLLALDTVNCVEISRSTPNG